MRYFLLLILTSYMINNVCFAEEIECDFPQLQDVKIIDDGSYGIRKFRLLFPKVPNGQLWRFETNYNKGEMVFSNQIEEGKIDGVDYYIAQLGLSHGHDPIKIEVVYHLQGGVCYSDFEIVIKELNAVLK